MLELVIVKGGWVMVPILVLSIYALAVIFYKIYQFQSLGVFSREFVEPSLLLIKREAYPEAVAHLAVTKSPLARVMQVATELVTNRELRRQTKEAEIMRVGAGELRRMESHLRGLEMSYTAAPLLGLLGTVLGMVTAFSKLAAVGSRVDPSILAGGIWEALMTTVAGLIVAVPALIAYYWFDSVVERMRAHMQDVTTQIMGLEDLLDPIAETQQAAAMVTPMRMTSPKAHYAAPSTKPASMQRVSTPASEPPREKPKPATKKNGGSRSVSQPKPREENVSLFSMNDEANDAPQTPAKKTKASSGTSRRTKKESAKPEPKQASSGRMELSPTYTKF